MAEMKYLNKHMGVCDSKQNNIFISRFLPHGCIELFLHHFVVGTDGHCWKVDFPHREIGALNGGDGGTRLPFRVDGLNQKNAETNT